MRITSVEAARSRIFTDITTANYRMAALAASFDIKPPTLVRLLASGVVFTMHDFGRTVIGMPFDEAKRITLMKGKQLVDLLKNCHPDDRPVLLQVMELAASGYDSEVMKHQERVQALCGKMADRLGLTQREKSDLMLAARLHDFGKIGIPNQILSIDSRFGKEGNEIKKLHLFFSLWLFEGVPWMKDLLAILKYNHILDGYPEDLMLKDMSLASKILSAADFFDALTNKRPYHEPESIEAAISEAARRPYDDALIKALVEAVSGLPPQVGTGQYRTDP